MSSSNDRRYRVWIDKSCWEEIIAHGHEIGDNNMLSLRDKDDEDIAVFHTWVYFRVDPRPNNEESGGK